MSIFLNIFIPFLQIDINEKLESAPDGNYQIGVIIGNFLPFALLAGLAWLTYYKTKNRKDLDD